MYTDYPVKRCHNVRNTTIEAIDKESPLFLVLNALFTSMLLGNHKYS